MRTGLQLAPDNQAGSESGILEHINHDEEAEQIIRSTCLKWQMIGLEAI
jgi:hypothetical protein